MTDDPEMKIDTPALLLRCLISATEADNIRVFFHEHVKISKKV
jgi:hypothetical protein